MSFWDRFRRNQNVTVQNVEPNRIHNVGLDDIKTEILDERSQNWVEFAPPKIVPTIKNCRKASKFPTVYGIINNLIMKTISSYVIDGDDQEAVDHILDTEKIWDLRNLMYEVLWKCIVDGEKSLIKKIYDDDGVSIKGYKQLVVKKSALKKWKGIKFWETYQDSEVITVDFEPDEITNPQLITIDGNGQSLVRNVIDVAYYIEAMIRQMPLIVYKSSNLLVATIGNENRSEDKIDEDARDYIAKELSDPHRSGVSVIPYGIDLELIGPETLPKVQDYIKSLKSILYEGLITPESLYSSESSNRSTAQVQLTDPQTGHVLFIEFCQEFLKSWVERVLIDPELEKHDYEKGSVYIDFMTGNPNLDTNYLVAENVEGSTALTTDNQPYEKVRNDGETDSTD